jgi:very-short-patch-repair endonuclease
VRARADQIGLRSPEEPARQAVGVAGAGDAAVAWVAARQHGVISSAQLESCGLSHDAIRHRCRNGRLHRLRRGLYLVGHRAEPSGARQMAAVLLCGPNAVLSHPSAAAWWGMAEERRGDPVHVTVAGRNAGSKPGVRVHRVTDLTRGDVRTRHGLPLTSPSRTLLDLASEGDGRALERALDEALALRLVRERDLVHAVERRRGRPGTARLRELLDDAPGTTRTRAESEERFLALVRRAELPAPELNVMVGSYEIDALWREQGLAVEIDSRRHHGGGQAFERDRIRDANLDDAGLRIRRFTWRRIVQQPEAVAATLARALASQR